jgi:REP element-mobilizing transposase RayT
MNWGNHRQDIFETDQDRHVFINTLFDSCEIYRIKLIGYVLMSSHFHLLIQTSQANLSDFMRHFLVSYTVRFNRRNGRSGHVFQGRFKSLLVDENEYLLPLSRYIHLNPIRTNQFKQADSAQKCEYLKTYRWSSFAGYCYLGKRVKHMDYGWFLSTYFGGDTAKGRRQFREYVYHAIEGDVENPFENVVHQSIIGAQDFVDWAKQMLPGKGQREVPSLNQLKQDLPVERIIAEVAKAANVKAGDLRDRRTKFKDLRRIAMELSYRYSNHKQKEIGVIFGVDYSTVSQNRLRLKRKLKSNRKLKKQFDQLLKHIDNLSNSKI